MDKILIWFLLWFTFYIFLNYILIPNNYTFRLNKIGITLLSISYIFLVYFIYNPKVIVSYTYFLPTFALFVTILDFLFLRIHKLVNLNKKHFLYRKRSPISGRFMEIAFQQFMLFILISEIFKNTYSPVLFSTLIFMSAHLPVLILNRLTFSSKLFVLFFSLAGGLVFSLVIYYVSSGLFISYLIHLTFYFVLGLYTGEDDQLIP